MARRWLFGVRCWRVVPIPTVMPAFTRWRRWLRQTCLTKAAAALSRSQAICRASASSRGLEENSTVPTTKVAFIGAGYMAEEHMRAFASLPDVSIAGIFSRTSAKAEKLAETHATKVFNSVEELYQETQADLVVVTVVELSMAEVASACFAYRWTVLLEKPAGYDLVDATRIR